MRERDKTARDEGVADHRLLLRESGRLVAKTQAVWKATLDGGFYPNELFYNAGIAAENIPGLNQIAGFENVGRVYFESDLWLPETPRIDLLMVFESKRGKEMSLSILAWGDEAIEIGGSGSYVQAVIDRQGKLQVEKGNLEASIKQLLAHPQNLVRAVDCVLDAARKQDLFQLYADHLRKEQEKLDYKPGVSVTSASSYPGFKKPEKRAPHERESSDNVRGDLAIANVLELIKHGYRVDLIDYKSSQDFRKAIQAAIDALYEKHNFFYEEEFYSSDTKPYLSIFRLWDTTRPGYSNARLEGLEMSHLQTPPSLRKILIQMEIEKLGLAGQIKRMTVPILRKQADIVIPDRGIRIKSLYDDHDDFRGYPRFQAESERKGNKEITYALQQAGLYNQDYGFLDMFGGTRVMVFNRDVLQLFQQKLYVPKFSNLSGRVNPEIYLNAVYYPVYLALALGLRVVSVPVDFTYPERQAKVEAKDKQFQEKRRKQFEDIVTGSKLYIKYLEEQRRKMRYDFKSYIEWLRQTNPDPQNLRWGEEHKSILP